MEKTFLIFWQVLHWLTNNILIVDNRFLRMVIVLPIFDINNNHLVIVLPILNININHLSLTVVVNCGKIATIHTRTVDSEQAAASIIFDNN